MVVFRFFALQADVTLDFHSTNRANPNFQSIEYERVENQYNCCNIRIIAAFSIFSQFRRHHGYKYSCRQGGKPAAPVTWQACRRCRWNIRDWTCHCGATSERFLLCNNRWSGIGSITNCYGWFAEEYRSRGWTNLQFCEMQLFPPFRCITVSTI